MGAEGEEPLLANALEIDKGCAFAINERAGTVVRVTSVGRIGDDRIHRVQRRQNIEGIALG